MIKLIAIDLDGTLLNEEKQISEENKKALAKAKAKGVKFGRPKVEPPDDFPEIVNALENKAITAKEAIKRSGMAEATFYRRLREYRKNRKENV